MRHHDKTKKFGRTKDQRNALMRSMARSLVLDERIITTEAKAKALRPYVEKLITKGKESNLTTRRMLISKIGSRSAVNKILTELGPKYKERNGGYTRITKLGFREKDASPQAMIEFV